jgi:O-antigen ligase
LPILAAGIIQSIFAIIQWYDPYFLFPTLDVDEFLGRAFGTLGHPSFLGQFMVFPMFAAIGLMVRRAHHDTAKSKELSDRVTLSSPAGPLRYGLRCGSGLLRMTQRGVSKGDMGFLFIVISFVLCLIGLLLSENRASILGLLGGLLFLTFLHLRDHSRRIRSLTWSLLSTAILLIKLTIITLPFLIPTSPTLANPWRSIQTRAAIWRQVPAMIIERPFFGVGFENFDIAFSPHTPPELLILEKPTEFADSAHNFFFDTLVHTGILGTAAFSGFLLTLLILFLRQKQATWLQKSQLSGIVSILISWHFGFPGITDAVVFFGMSGLIILNVSRRLLL